jgi:hypothetical protein
MELHYNRDLLKSVLTQLASHASECAMLHAEEVVVFHSKYRSIVKEKQEEETIPYYNELASDNFKIITDDSDLKTRFEQIKESIRCNR